MTLGDAAFVVALGVIATLYASVGQAGGTGYVALLALAGFASDTIKSTALALNILVAAIGCVRFYRARMLTWRSCYPFAILGAPFSLIGGAIHLPAAVYQPVVGVMLLLAGWLTARSVGSAALRDQAAPEEPPFLPSLIVGGAIGLVSGITGVGGGIFLAPLVLALGWAETRQTAAISTVFNLLNSATALAGLWATAPAFPPALPVWLAAVGAGAFVGSWLGARYLKPPALRAVLALLLFAAGVRMVASALF